MIYGIDPAPLYNGAMYLAPPESGIAYSIRQTWDDPLFTPPNATTYRMQTTETAWPHPESGAALVIPAGPPRFTTPGQARTFESGAIPPPHTLAGEKELAAAVECHAKKTGSAEPPQEVEDLTAIGCAPWQLYPQNWTWKNGVPHHKPFLESQSGDLAPLAPVAILAGVGLAAALLYQLTR